MTAMGLTRRQHETLTFISERVRESGIAPSFTEMGVALNIRSKSGVHRLVTALEDRGFIVRRDKCARAIEILRLPANLEDSQRPPLSRGQMRRSARPAAAIETNEGAFSVPVVGRLSVWTPVEALQNRISEISVPAGMAGRGGHYALEVVGDSMLNAGILDGDTVIISETDKCSSGEIVVALIDDSEVTLKRLRRRGDSISLEAANFAYETRLYHSGRVKIQGRLVGLIRRY